MMREKQIVTRDELQETTFKIQKMIGKLLNHSDIWIIVNLNKSHGLDYIEIERVFRHCIERGNRNITYIEKVAIAYAENGIEALAEVDNLSIDYIEKGFVRQSKSKLNKHNPSSSRKNTAKPVLPYAEEEKSHQDLQNIPMRIEIKSILEKEALLRVLEQHFFINKVSALKLNEDKINPNHYIDIIVTKR